MDIEYFTPLNHEILTFHEQLTSQHLGSKMKLHTNDNFPDLSKCTIVLIGVLEDRNDKKDNAVVDLNSFRKQLYQLYPGNWSSALADLGDILPGNSKQDTFFALQAVVADLIKSKIIPVVVGGSHDCTYPLYRAYDFLDQMVNLVVVDKKFDFGKESDAISPDSYLTKIIVEEPNNLFNFTNIGFQSYYNSQEEIDLVEKLYFDSYRLGTISQDNTISEPVFRDADVVSVDLCSVASTDKGNFEDFEPNGFSGKEICTLCRYAGISDKLSVFGIFGHKNNPNEALLMAQMVWYFIEGVNFRTNEYPFSSKENYIKYIVTTENQDVIFYKSNKSDRWWIEIPDFQNENNKFSKHTLFPCTYQEYLSACQDVYPERWWKAQRKMLG